LTAGLIAYGAGNGISSIVHGTVQLVLFGQGVTWCWWAGLACRSG
jgi:hypothetical protein